MDHTKVSYVAERYAGVRIRFGSQVYCALGDHSSLVHNPRAFPHRLELEIMMLMMPYVVSRVSLTLREPC